MMNDIISNDDKFMVSNYLHDNKPEVLDTEFDAQKWADDCGTIIMAHHGDLNDLEDQWIQFNGLIKKKRRESDWKSIELYGMTNQERYEKNRSELLKDDIDNPIENISRDQLSESFVDDLDSLYKSNPIAYSSSDVENAEIWAKENNRVIILPTRTLYELEELWSAYNMMIKKHRRESDWKSEELFGLSNLQHYEYLKNQFLKEDLRKEDKDQYGSIIEGVTVNRLKKYFNTAMKESFTESTQALGELLISNNDAYDDVVISNIVSDVMDKVDADIIDPSDAVDLIACGDCPYLSPEEMIDMGVYGQAPVENHFGVLADNSMLNDTLSVKEWFEIYKNYDKGLYTEFGNYTADWIQKLRTLIHELSLLKDSGDEDTINAKKQSILELGWDPDIEFDNKARMLAREFAIHRMKSNFSGAHYKMINLSEFKSVKDLGYVNEASTDLKPVYIVLIEGKSYFSKAIKTLTKDIYSHSAISLDPYLHNMYSYGIATNERSVRKGFRREDIVDLPIGGRIGVYTFFVSDRVYKKIEDFINSFKDNAEKTSYSFMNLITYLFNIPYNKEWSLICSQFVDRCLQAADINITKKDSSTVSPSDLRKAAQSEERIYCIYEGLHSNYNGDDMFKLVNALSHKAKALKEFAQYYDGVNENKYIVGVLNNINNIDALLELKEYSHLIKNPRAKRLLENVLFDAIDIRPIQEAKRFPIQFDKEGNLLIKNIKKLDYEAEYAKSHKLLKQYYEANNLEGMKYELSKLWMMLCLIDDWLHSPKANDLPSMAIASSKEVKAKAKINNDFEFYMKKLLKEEPKFNFTEYYDASPFSSATIQIDNSTLEFMGKAIKKFIKSI